MEEKNIINIPKEKFEFANIGEKLSDTKFDTKPIGYFKDAMIRFRKNRASVVAAIIIALIVVYAFIVPILTPTENRRLMDIKYAQKGPRITALKESLGIFTGGVEKTYSEAQYIFEVAKGVGALEANGEHVSLKEAMTDNKYQPVTKLYKVESVKQGRREALNYTIKMDSYVSVGFIYVDIEQTEYDKIKAWEAETGLRVLYPLIDVYTPENKVYCFDVENANYWYKASSANSTKMVPISTAGGVDRLLEYSDDLVLEDNYYRIDGELQYRKYIGGGGFETAQYRVRILYYNYYIYKNNIEPNYLLGTDNQGYNLAVRMADGIKLSLLLAIVVSAINFVIGAMYGAVEGYYGGAIDLTLERVSDILAGVPFIIVATLFQKHLADDVGPVVSLIFAFIVTGWIGTASRVRTQFYRFKNQEYVMAARTLGARDRRIIWKHIFPNTLGTIITSSVLVIPGVIFSESMLSFLGIVNLGGSKFTSLGTLLSDASSIWTKYPHLMVAPATIISLLMICFNLFGNGLRDAFNPTLRGVEE